jgi:PAS domain S-box-containing protein
MKVEGLFRERFVILVLAVDLLHDFQEMLELGALFFRMRRLDGAFEQMLDGFQFLGDLVADLERFMATLDSTSDAVFMFSLDTLHLFYVNQGAANLTGYDIVELLAMTALDVAPTLEEKDLLVSGHTGDRRASPRTFEIDFRRKDATLVATEASLQFVRPMGENARYVAIVRDISDRRKVDKMKSEFISTVSHELRTPLTSIMRAGPSRRRRR